MAARRKLIYVVTEDWFFCSHFLPMARAALAAGFDVAVATRCGAARERILAEGLRPLPVPWRRGSLNPLPSLATLVALVGLLRRERPDLVHNIALKPVLLGSLACRLAGVGRVVNAVTGLGYAFTATEARLVRAVAARLLAAVGRLPGNRFLVENRDHEAMFAAAGWAAPAAITRVTGAGVDLVRYRPTPLPAGPVTEVALVARMITIKGIAVAVAAVRRLAAAGVPIRLHLVGAPDGANKGAIPRRQLEAWGRDPAIRWHGRRDDVAALWGEMHAAVLPALGGDGLPKSLLEAAACGRAIVTTDTPGCREAVIAGDTGLVVPPGDVEALAAALGRVAADRALCQRMGTAARRLAEDSFGEAAVAERVLALYRDMLGEA